MSAIVALEGVTRTYGHGVHALSDTSLLIDQGEMVAIVGPSGSGKSTLLNMMGTLDRPTSGDVFIDGHRVMDLSDRELAALRASTIGFVFQQFHLSQGVSVLDNVADGLLYSGVPLRKRRAQAAEVLSLVGLTHRLNHKPHQLSGGERQRVAISRAIIDRPKLLLADEPTGNLDSVSGATVMKLLHELHGSGTTVVVITHDLEVAAQMPRQIRIKDGRVDNEAA